MRGVLFKRYGIGIVLVELAAVFLCFGVKNITSPPKEKTPQYMTAEAVITGKTGFEGIGGYIVDVTYKTASGAEYSGKAEYFGDAETGDIIEVSYNAYNPEIFMCGAAETPAEKDNSNKIYGITELAAGAVLLVSGALLLKRKLSSENAVSEG